MGKFIVLDVETANSNLSSICQIGLVVFDNGEIVDSWESLVNPQVDFDAFNIEIHGITPNMVSNAPTMEQLLPTLLGYIENQIVCSYTFFDRKALSYFLDIKVNQITWLDITRAVRAVWTEFSQAGYGLSNIAKHKKIKLENHHNALCDAQVAGLILLKVMEEANLSLSEILDTASKSNKSNISRIKLDGSEDGVWFGEVLTFTGELSLPRKEAAKLASEVGFEVGSSVTKKTTFLVKGNQDASKLNGKDISSKEQKALELIRKGTDIQFLSEADFFSIVQN